MIVNFTFYVFFAYNVIWYGYIGHRDFSNYQDFLNKGNNKITELRTIL